MNSRLVAHSRTWRTLVGVLLSTSALVIALGWHSQSYADSAKPRVRMKTNMGTIVLELDASRAPLTVANFLAYVKSGHYNDTIFHRVIAGFMIQGGGFTDKNVEKPTQKPVVNESGNGLSNRRWTIAMARTGDPHSGTSQFYINVADNVSLDPQPGRWGYTVFGKVAEGMEVVQKISETPTGTSGQLDDAPIKQVIIEKMELVD
jgi:peptidyl-prolyl cis-trans isomerase A (cyclophilin A)/peptidyl-prolyl cis-trans isomerase B (cyclophilin B)